MSKYTAGPWKVEEGGDIGESIGITTQDKETICYCEPFYNQEEANARLITAAPELLEACEYIRKVLLILERTQALPIPTVLRNNIECLGQVITKAEGE